MFDEVTRILAVCHGETTWNVDKRVQGQIDISLNTTGQQQAQRLAAAHPDRTPLLVTRGSVLDCPYRAASRVALNVPRT